MDTLINRESTQIVEDGLELTSGICQVEIQRSQLDGEMVKILSGAGGGCCQFCTATFKQIHDPDMVKDGFPINRSITYAKVVFEEVNEEEFFSLSSNQRFNITHKPISDLDIIPSLLCTHISDVLAGFYILLAICTQVYLSGHQLLRESQMPKNSLQV